MYKAKLRYRRTNNKHRPFTWCKMEIVRNNANKGAFGFTYEIGNFILSRNITPMRSAFLWDITQRMVLIRYRRFGTTYKSHFQGSFWIYWSLKIEKIFSSASNANAPQCHLWSAPLYSIFPWYLIKDGDRGSTVVKVLCYKSEGRWFDPSWCLWNFSLT